MTSVFQPPPTWALPVIADPTTKEGVFNPIWLKWFVELSKNLDATGSTTTTTITTVLETASFQPPREEFRPLQFLEGNASSILASQIFGT